MTLKGTYAGIIVGGITVLIWKQFNWFGLYELIPGFLFSTISIILISLMDEKPSQTILDNFNISINEKINQNILLKDRFFSECIVK